MELLGLGTAAVVAALGRGVVQEKEELAALQPSNSGLGFDCVNQISQLLVIRALLFLLGCPQTDSESHYLSRF